MRLLCKGLANGLRYRWGGLARLAYIIARNLANRTAYLGAKPRPVHAVLGGIGEEATLPLPMACPYQQIYPFLEETESPYSRFCLWILLFSGSRNIG